MLKLLQANIKVSGRSASSITFTNGSFSFSKRAILHPSSGEGKVML
jgi:hypothetical protein